MSSTIRVETAGTWCLDADLVEDRDNDRILRAMRDDHPIPFSFPSPRDCG
ncbi:MAG: hypothetical protein ACREO3_02655 [Arenimonas sp.]